MSNASTPASFVRPTRPRDQRRSFVEAVKEKYASAAVPEEHSEVVRISGKDVEEVGFDKDRRRLANLQELRVIVLDDMCIGEDVANPTALAEGVRDTCPKCVELDLSRNLFESWTEIWSIVIQLPALSSLRINGNRFVREHSSAQMAPVVVLSTVGILSMDECLFDFHTVCNSSIPGNARLILDCRFDRCSNTSLPFRSCP